jgi:hypothetical protein
LGSETPAAEAARSTGAGPCGRPMISVGVREDGPGDHPEGGRSSPCRSHLPSGAPDGSCRAAPVAVAMKTSRTSSRDRHRCQKSRQSMGSAQLGCTAPERDSKPIVAVLQPPPPPADRAARRSVLACAGVHRAAGQQLLQHRRLYRPQVPAPRRHVPLDGHPPSVMRTPV